MFRQSILEMKRVLLLVQEEGGRVHMLERREKKKGEGLWEVLWGTACSNL